MKTQKVELGNLKFNPELLAIRKLNTFDVSRYRQAYRSGADMPLPIIEEGTLKIVSGNHRVTAMIMEYGEERTIDVILKKYKTKKEMLIDFTKENCTHGVPFSGFQKKTLISVLINEGLSTDEIALLFNVPARSIEKWGDDIVMVQRPGRKFVEIPSPKKRGFEPQDNKVTQEQYVHHIDHDRGVPVTSMARQLTNWLNIGAINQTEVAIDSLNLLHEALHMFFDSTEELRAVGVK